MPIKILTPMSRVHLDTHRPLLEGETVAYYFHRLRTNAKSPDFFSVRVGASWGYLHKEFKNVTEKGVQKRVKTLEEMRYDLVGRVVTAPLREQHHLGRGIEEVIKSLRAKGYQHEVIL